MIPLARMLKYGYVRPVRKDIVKVGTVGNAVVLLMDNGNVYVRGQNSNGSLGVGVASSNITGDWYLTTTNATKMWTGSGNILIYTNDGKWMSTGNIQYLSGASSGSNVWRDVTSYFAGLIPSTILDLKLGNDTLFVLTTSGQIYSSGANTYGVQGRGNTTAVNGLTLAISTYGSYTWTAIGYENGTFYALRTDGQVWGSGRADLGQCGATSSTGVLSPRFLTANCTLLSAGTISGYVAKADGVYSIGSQFWGQLGDGTVGSNTGAVGKTVFTNVYNPTNLTYITSAGYMTTLCANGELYSTGALNRGSVGSTSQVGSFRLQEQVPTFNPSKVKELYCIGSTNAYLVDVNGDLYGTGTYSATTDLLPGYTSNQLYYVALNMNGVDRGV